MKQCLFILPLFILIQIGCSKIGYTEKVESSRVYFSSALPVVFYLHVGDEAPISLVDFPEEFKTVFVSGDEDVASVSTDGVVTAKKIGDTQIAISNKGLNVTKSVSIHVMPDDVFTFWTAYLRLLPIKGGTFTMGNDEYPSNTSKTVTVDDFMLADMEVTEELYTAVIAYPSIKPIIHVYSYPYSASYNHFDEVFLATLREKTGLPFRFPTEAEWEYAARAGDDFQYSGGNNMNELGWYKDSPHMDLIAYNNNGRINRPVQYFKPNAWGFYDMCGGAAEWVSDLYKDQQPGPEYHIAKGGSVLSPAADCHIWCRGLFRMNDHGPTGLRVAL